jgi:hypothetical protein
MLEWLVTIGTAELGKAIFEQALKLGQAAAEDYVKDFFKGCLKEGITAAKPEVTKKAVAEALKTFLLLVTDELEDQELSKAEIRDRDYEAALTQFVQNNSVKPILGKAFEKECRAIDVPTLATIWQQSTLKGKLFPTMPAEFDWQRIGNEYLKKVRRIIRETPELRSLLETDLLEDIARNTAQLSPGFDVETYRNSLQSSYGYLKLYTLDSTDRVDAIKLWSIFIEQTVREALPPMRYDLPLDARQKSEVLKISDFSMHEYFQQPARKILAAVADSQRAVILGDPGSGKSSLLQYLALEWVEGKTEKLPCDRADLYDQASRVLLYHWDVDHKRLHIPMDAIGRREKQEMLLLIAYEMQAGADGLKGNLIESDRLTRILTDYLRDQGFSEPREKANLLIHQLRERNFILCYRGADTYGFMHRTFLEYFCAVEIVDRFEKQRTLTFEQLRDEVFGNHWQDETWHEVLKLIFGMIEVKIARELIELLIEAEGKNHKFKNLFLAAECFATRRNHPEFIRLENNLLDNLKSLIDFDLDCPYDRDRDRDAISLVQLIQSQTVSTIASTWQLDQTYFWLKECANFNKNWAVCITSVQEIARRWKDQIDTFGWLKGCAINSDNVHVRSTAIQKLATGWKDDPDILQIFKSGMSHKDWRVRSASLESLSLCLENDFELFDTAYNYALNDPFNRKYYFQINPRKTALEALLTHYPTHPKTIELLRDRALNDPDEQLREWAQEQLKMQNVKLTMEDSP